MQTPKNIRYTKNLLTTELMTAKSAENLPIYDENKTQITEKMKNDAFQLAGAFPYLFDGITMLCNENPMRNGEPIISLIKDSAFYHVTLRWEDFLYYTLGEYRKACKDTLMKEIRKIDNQPPKCLALGTNFLIRARPITINICYYQDEASEVEKSRLTSLQKRWTNLLYEKYKLDEEHSLINDELNSNPTEQNFLKEKENSQAYLDAMTDASEMGKLIAGVEITFFGPLFEAALDKNSGAFIKIGTNFQSKLETAIRKYKESDIFFKYRSVKKYPLTYRKYALYLTERNNGTSDYVTIKAQDMLLHVDTQQLKADKRIRNSTEMRIFVDKANLLLNQMAKDGLMKGFPMIPIKCTYNPINKEFCVSVSRNKDENEIPNYEGNIGNDELDNINKNISSEIAHNAF